MDKKKLISIGVVVLTIVVVIIIAATSGGSGNDPEVIPPVSTTTPVIGNNMEIILGYSAEVLEKSLKVYRDDIFVQELIYPTDNNSKFDLEFAKKHISFIDMNFDGKEDICLTISETDGLYSYYCWIYDTKNDSFEYSKSLSSLTLISIDNEKKQVISTEEKDGKKVYVIYEWKDGEFKKGETQTKEPSAVKDNVLGSTSSGNTTSRPDKNPSNGNNSGLSGVVTPGVTNSQGSSGGIVVETENKNDIWY